MKHLKTFEAYSFDNKRVNNVVNEDLRKNLKKYISQNEDELNRMADADQWDMIYNNLRSEFDIVEGSKEDKDMIETFKFMF